MTTPPNASQLHIVLESLIGGNPYDDDYPRNPIITFEKGEDGTIHRIFFALYGNRIGSFRAEMRQLPRQWPNNRRSEAATRCSLMIERYFESNRTSITSERIRNAFLMVALKQWHQEMGVKPDTATLAEMEDEL